MSRDYASEFVCRLRLDEVARERGIVNKRGEPDVAAISEATGIHKNVVRRMINGETKGIDFVNLTRLCVGLRISPNDLFEIDAQ